ncbi:hypothetical protein A5893_09400 [Pedobacter psychrophilus]|uniref:Right handed beta helix domain-containing protein n=1 Tax=Pedobacter psychrophilus TaxID=1826909 RepID=A0A179DG63_9SPHI|nr:right-handed parallel beta-helix repeat-containing protein [Pedobacter psychrophilus]OAQ39782.1 hypothetical protein A5893_09400 [Pedobacter psychrophilus]
MNKIFNYLLVLLFCLTFIGCKKKSISDDSTKPVTPPVVTSKTYYVSPTSGSDINIGLVQAAPFRTLQKAVSVTNPGDIVLLMDGVFNSNSGPVITINRSGSDGKYITYKPMPGANPKITASGNVWDAVVINANYIIFEGLELEGNNANLTYVGARKAYDDNIAGLIPPDANYNTNGITIGRDGFEPHHVTIRNCKIHDFPAGGLGTSRSDYITYEGNTIYNNSWFTMYATSGISTINSKDIDANTGYKMIVRNNLVYNNKTLIPWKAGSGNYRLSDGNGIIIDANQGTQGTGVYNGRTLVENNISHNNGGSGIHSFQSAHVDIRNNTAFNNGAIVGYGEIFGQSGSDIKIYNNIMYARATQNVDKKTVGECNMNDRSAQYVNNVYFNGAFYNITTTAGAVSKGNIQGNPLFLQLPVIPASAVHTNISLFIFNIPTGFNLSLATNSPAINAGTSEFQLPTVDFLGTARVKNGVVDCGAYEVN